MTNLSCFQPSHHVPIWMGILNVTPDSFSDGGEACLLHDQIEKAEKLIKDGTYILDLGGESTRPGAPCVPEDIELQRLLPIVRELRRLHPEIPLSIDTRKASVAHSLLEEGVAIINDVSGGRFNPEILQETAQKNAFYVLMHSRATPDEMQHTQHCTYINLFDDIFHFFDDGIQRAVFAGIPPEKIILDVGLGFAKTAEQCWDLVNHYERFINRYPDFFHLIGHSRKSFFKTIVADPDPKARDTATLKLTQQLAPLSNKIIFRIHNVALHARAYP